jgi:hypothetical protein
MKNVLKIAVAALFAGIWLPLAVQAQETNSGKKSSTVTTTTDFTPGNFVDKNKDGICDNRETRPAEGRRRNFVDSNGDGLCDNTGRRGQGLRAGKGRCGNGQGSRQRNGGNAGPGVSQPQKP